MVARARDFFDGETFAELKRKGLTVIYDRIGFGEAIVKVGNKIWMIGRTWRGELIRRIIRAVLQGIIVMRPGGARDPTNPVSLIRRIRVDAISASILHIPIGAHKFPERLRLW